MLDARYRILNFGLLILEYTKVNLKSRIENRVPSNEKREPRNEQRETSNEKREK